jgi:hypothetical protein
MLRRATDSDLSVIVDLKLTMFAEAGRAHLLSDQFREMVLQQAYGAEPHWLGICARRALDTVDGWCCDRQRFGGLG